METLFQTDLSLPKRQGKVRDIYELDDGRLVIVASDRLSAYDVVLPTTIPGKGRLLTRLAEFWLRWIESEGICRTHLLSTDVADIPQSAWTEASVTPEQLAGRVTIGRRCEVLPIECVVRGYLEGSGWREYVQTGEVCGVPLPKGLERCSKLDEPIFTPATKAEQGEHDENISAERAAEIIGSDRLAKIRDFSMEIYARASAHARERGIIIADTKFEFGVDPNDPKADPILIDEALTPDSSRFWPVSSYKPGQSQPSFDKQYVREYLETLVARGEWDKSEPGPELPEDVVRGTQERYTEALRLLTS
ncbi:MAG TPA: phosphoribosylaminoimidazolesuccinocarboxamide synthase [Phycisphaerales bacterium]|nr:phosphoribosylaminoimidazolesuccinocarboxamide synthase [Phycisphaerales bacterium]